MRGSSLILAAAILAPACGTAPPPTMPSSPVAPPVQQEAVFESLFPGDAEILSDSAIRRILAYEFAIPTRARIAVLQLGSLWSYRRWWTDELARLSSEVAQSFDDRLRQSPRVADVDVLPMLLIPQKRTVPYLREAAARFQADLLLVYQPLCAVFERSRFLRANQYRVTCTVEALLLDTRSGIVPFSGFATQEQVAQKGDDDFELRETLAKAELAVARQGMAELAARIVAFLEGTATLNR